MKKIYFLALLFISSFSFAQSELNFVGGDISYGTGNLDENFFIIESLVTNSSQASMTVTWERDEFDLAPGWFTQICDINLCYLQGTDTESFVIEAGDTAFIHTYFWPNENNGCSQVRIKVSQNGNESVNFDEFVYYGRAGDVDCLDFEEQTSLGIEDEKVQTLNLYPNPVMSTLNVSFNNIDNASTVEVYNLTGKRVDRIDLDGETSMRINAYDWNEGMYILSILDDTDRLIKTQRFSKVQ